MNYPSIEAIKRNPVMTILSGHTCGEACWHARDEVCRCSCGGANHGILNNGSVRPERTSKKDGHFYIIAGIAPSYREANKMLTEYLSEHFPGIDLCAYGNYRDMSTMPVISRKASASQLKWPEVQAIQVADRQEKYIVWSLPIGSKYVTKCSKSAFYSKTKEFEPALTSLSI